MSEHIRNGICVLVSIAWAASIALSMISPDYHPPPTLNIAFTGVLGLALATGRDRDKDPKP